MTPRQTIQPKNPKDILARMLDGAPLSEADALLLLESTEPALASAMRDTANTLRQRQAGDTVPYEAGCSLFLTNLCELKPSIYRYPKQPGDTGARILTIDDIDATLELARIREARHLTLRVGFWSALQIPGLEAPTLLKTLHKLLDHILDRYPELSPSGFSPDELDFLSVVSDRSPRYLLEFLKDRGVATLDGHAAGVLVDTVRQSISPKYCPVRDWLAMAEQAVALGFSLILPLEYGHLESPADRVKHLSRLSGLAKKYPQAIQRLAPQPIPVSALKTDTSTLPLTPLAQSTERLKFLALCRLLLGEAVPHIQTQWLPGGEEEAQEGLLWGASHFGGTNAMATGEYLGGTFQPSPLSSTEIETLIQATGHTAQRV